MAQKKADLCVAVNTYKDRNGEERTQLENIGVEMKGDDGKIFFLLKPWINLSGIPHDTGKHVAVYRFTSKAASSSSAALPETN